MTSRRPLLLVAVLAAGVSALPASAASKVSFTETYTVTDMTPDPSGQGTVADSTCHGPLTDNAFDTVMPDELHKLVLKGKGSLEITTEETGDWRIELYDAKDQMVSSNDALIGLESEALFFDAPRRGTYSVYMCNLTAVPTATVHVTYTAKK